MVARRVQATPEQARDIQHLAARPAPERVEMRAAAMSAELARQDPNKYPETNVLEPTNPLEVGAPLPNSIGKCADLYSDVRTLRLAMDKEVEKVKARESEIREHIISNLSKSDDTGAAGLRYRAQIVMKDSPRCMDWPAFWAYVAQSKRFDLVQKRLGDKACMDTIGDGQKIPGVEVVHIPDVSITKI